MGNVISNLALTAVIQDDDSLSLRKNIGYTYCYILDCLDNNNTEELEMNRDIYINFCSLTMKILMMGQIIGESWFGEVYSVYPSLKEKFESLSSLQSQLNRINKFYDVKDTEAPVPDSNNLAKVLNAIQNKVMNPIRVSSEITEEPTDIYTDTDIDTSGYYTDENESFFKDTDFSWEPEEPESLEPEVDINISDYYADEDEPTEPAEPAEPMESANTVPQYTEALSNTPLSYSEASLVSIEGTEDIVLDQDDINRIQEEKYHNGSIKRIDESCIDIDVDNVDVSDVGYSDDIREVVKAIINRNEAVFRGCVELDRPYGMLYEKGMLKYKISDEGTLQLIPGVASGNSTFEKLYKAVIEGAGTRLVNAPDLRNVPNGNNIVKSNIEYFPGFMFKYALGLVDNKKYSNWSGLSKALDKSIDTRLRQLMKLGLFFNNEEKIQRAYSTAILVLSYESGGVIQLRVSLPGHRIDQNRMEESIRSIMTYRNANIAIQHSMGFEDVVDIKIIQDEEKFISRPYWAYKAMKVKIQNNEKPSLNAGLPIGRKLNDEIVEYKLDPSDGFMTFVAAGSGAGKGVLTLSLVAAALGSQIPLFYMDYKPDMAPIFWDMSKQFGVNTFAFDGMSENDGKRTYKKSHGIPKELENDLGGFTGPLMYLRCLQLMCVIAQYRQEHGARDNGIMFIFDEIEKVQSSVKEAYAKIKSLNTAHKPKTVKGVKEEADMVYNYTSVLLDWIANVDGNLTAYTVTTGRASNTFTLFIAQSPDYGTWSSLNLDKDIKLFGKITNSGTVVKILGKGTSSSKYGLGGTAGGKLISEKERKYIENYRFFGMYKGKSTDSGKIDVFKPFLTLNSDDIMEKCWVGGMGKRYGAGTLSEQQYIANVAADHPGENGFTNKYGVHTGTGLLGLTSMYCNGDTEAIKNGLKASWDYVVQFFKETGLDKKYASPVDYMFDNSIDGFMTTKTMLEWSPEKDNSVILGISSNSDVDPSDPEKPVETNWNVGNEPFGKQGEPSWKTDTDEPIGDSGQNGIDNSSQFGSARQQSRSSGPTNEELLESLKVSPAAQAARAAQMTQANNTPIGGFNPEEAIEAGATSERYQPDGFTSLGGNTQFSAQLEKEMQEQGLFGNDEESIARMAYERSRQTYEDISESRIREIIQNSMSEMPEGDLDVLDWLAAFLYQDAKSEVITPVEAEAVARSLRLVEKGVIKSYDYSLGLDNLVKPQSMEFNPENESKLMKPSEPAVEFTGRNGQKILIDLEKTKPKRKDKLTDENSINVYGGIVSEPSIIDSFLMGTPDGAARYIQRTWKGILKAIVRQGYNPANIVKVSLYGGMMYVNGKIVILDGIVGGRQNIRLRDLVDFSLMFNQFPHIKELRLDEEMIRAAIAELGENVTKKLFALGNKLEVIYVKDALGDDHAIQRTTIHLAEELEQEAIEANEMDMHCRALKGRGWDMTDISDTVWGMKLAKNSFKKSGKAFMDESRPKVGTAVIHMGVGLIAGTIGPLAWGVRGLGRGIIGMFNNHSR